MSPSFRLTCKLSGRAEFLHDFVAQAIKAAIGHDEQEIASLGFGPKILRNGVRTRKHAGVFAELTDTFRNGLGVQAILASQLLGTKNASENDAVAKSQRLRQRILKHFPAHGIGSRLENSPQPASGPAAACGFDRRLHGSGVMRKIINHQYASDFAFTSIRRFTLRNVASALAISEAGMPRPCATISAAMAFKTLWRPVATNSNSPKNVPPCATRNRIVSPSIAKSLATQSFPSLKPYVSTGQKAFSVARRKAGPDSSASPQITTRPRRGTRFTNRRNANW